MNNKKFKDHLRQLGKVNPSEEFRSRFKADLRAKIAGERSSFFVRFLPVFNKNTEHCPGTSPLYNFVKNFAFAGVLSVFLIFMGGFFLYSSSTSAGEESYLQEVSGSVEISKGGNDFDVAKTEEVLGNGSVLRTGDSSSASVVFFEDSVLRLDANTEVEIKTLLPHPLVSDMGVVSIELKSGRIWVKSLAENSDYAGIEVYAGDLLITPENSALDVEINGDVSLVRVFERSSKVAYRGTREKKTAILIAGNEVQSSLIGLSNIEKITNEEKSSTWVQENLTKDTNYMENFIDQQTEYFESPLVRLKENVALTWGADSGEKYFALAQRNFHNAIVELRAGDKDAGNNDLAEFATNLDKAISMDSSLRSEIEAELQKAKKYLQFSVPTDDLFLAKKAVEDALEKVATDPVAVRLKANKETLWEVHALASADPYMASEHLKTFTEDLQADAMENEGATIDDPEAKAEILEQKTEELEILSDLQDNSITGQVMEDAENEVIAEVAQVSTPVVRVGFPGDESAKKGATENNYLDSINKYQTVRGQENALRQILLSIPNDSSSLELLQQMKQEVPIHLKRLVIEKIMEITKIERQKALLEAS